jgi:hypothetical protein
MWMAMVGGVMRMAVGARMSENEERQAEQRNDYVVV